MRSKSKTPRARCGELRRSTKPVPRFETFDFYFTDSLFQLTDDTQDDQNDLNNINITGLGIKEEAPAPKIKIKRDDTQFLVDQLRYKKEAAEALLIAHEGDLKKAVFADLGLDSLPTPPELSKAREIADNFEFKSVKYH